MKKLIEFLYECLWEYDFSNFVGKKLILEVAQNGSIILKEFKKEDIIKEISLEEFDKFKKFKENVENDIK